MKSYFRTVVNFLFNYNILLRGKFRRKIKLFKLFKLFLILLPNEYPIPYHIIILIINNEKINQFGRIEYEIVIYYRNPLFYTIFHTIFYFFYRWNIVRKPPYCGIWVKLCKGWDSKSMEVWPFDEALAWVSNYIW
jgi:hypothetical protein